MILFAFIAFFVLVVAWLLAPTGEAEAVPAAASAPALKVGEAPA